MSANSCVFKWTIQALAKVYYFEEIIFLYIYKLCCRNIFLFSDIGENNCHEIFIFQRNDYYRVVGLNLVPDIDLRKILSAKLLLHFQYIPLPLSCS